MSTPLEHDYIGLSEASSMEKPSDNVSSSSCSTVSTEDEKNNPLNFKETELRLGLPGSEFPERKAGPRLPLFGEDNQSIGYLLSPVKNFVSGAKRGFSDAIDRTDKWVLSMNGGSELDLGKSAATSFLPRGGKTGLESNNKGQQSCLPLASSKDILVSSSSPKPAQENKTYQPSPANHNGSAPASKAQVVGWPPIRSFRKNTIATNLTKNNDDEGKSGSGCLYVKVSMEGAPYQRKVDLKTYSNYVQLSSALEKMFSCFTIGQCSSHGIPGRDGLSESHIMDLLHGSEYVLAYEDKDGDWMLVGDVPWEMFAESCKKLRIMKGSEAIGLAPRAMEKVKNRN